MALAAQGCVHIPFEGRAQDRQPPPPELLRRLRPELTGADLELELLETSGDRSRFRFRFDPNAGDPMPAWPGAPAGAGDSVGDAAPAPAAPPHAAKDPPPDGPFPPERAWITGEYYQTVAASASSPAPLLQVSPILGGAYDDYLASRVFSAWANDAGMSAFFLYQEDRILAPERSGADLERLLIETTRANIQAIELLSRRPEVDREKLGSFGISMGAIKNVLLAIAEPRLRGNILCMAAGDFPRIIELSREGLVLSYIRDRGAVAGLRKAEIVDDLRRNLLTDPIRVARWADPGKIILFLATLDDKVPYATGVALYEELGRPELHLFPVGHYTALVTAPRAASVGFAWLQRRFESP